MNTAVGKKIWALPDMYWPSTDNGEDYVSHEAICILNVSSSEAHVSISFLFEDREPIDGLLFTCQSMRTTHIRIDNMKNTKGLSLPRGVGYAALLQSDTPVIVQYTRVDTTQPELALMTTMAYSV